MAVTKPSLKSEETQQLRLTYASWYNIFLQTTYYFLDWDTHSGVGTWKVQLATSYVKCSTDRG